jgi:two-component system LytT family response regulator
MPRQNGFDLLRKIGHNIDFDVIFVTAYNQYAIRAIECSAIGFILKPIQNDKLIAAVNVVSKKRIHKENYENLLTLLSKGQREAKLAIPTEKGIEFVKIMDIIYLEADGKYTIFHIIKGKNKISSYGLSYYSSILSTEIFFQTHRSFIINLSYVLRYEKPYNVFLENEVEIPLARSKKNEFLQWMKP